MYLIFPIRDYTSSYWQLTTNFQFSPSVSSYHYLHSSISMVVFTPLNLVWQFFFAFSHLSPSPLSVFYVLVTACVVLLKKSLLRYYIWTTCHFRREFDVSHISFCCSLWPRSTLHWTWSYLDKLSVVAFFLVSFTYTICPAACACT